MTRSEIISLASWILCSDSADMESRLHEAMEKLSDDSERQTLLDTMQELLGTVEGIYSAIGASKGRP